MEAFEVSAVLPADPQRIYQAWLDGAADSRLEVLLEKAKKGTRVTLRHSEIPERQGKMYEEGWKEHYFTPMKRYFASRKGA